MNLVMRRREMMKRINSSSFDPHNDLVRIIAKGANGPTELANTFLSRSTEQVYIDGVITSIPFNTTKYIFNDHNYHDIFHDGEFQKNQCISSYTHIIDFPVRCGYYSASFQTLRHPGGSIAIHVIIRANEYVFDGDLDWNFYKWTKNNMYIYVPNQLVETYKQSANWDKGTILPIEGSIFETRLPMDTIITSLNLQ